MAAVTLTPTPDGGTELVLTHRGVPKELIPETERAWREQYWSRIKAYLADVGVGSATIRTGDRSRAVAKHMATELTPVV
jgi:hypothetical protein